MAVKAFVIGDVVTLKSGGPMMTIAALAEELSDDQNNLCYWFSQEEVLEEHLFPVNTLKKIKI